MDFRDRFDQAKAENEQIFQAGVRESQKRMPAGTQSGIGCFAVIIILIILWLLFR
jgi:hypothetical protein